MKISIIGAGAMGGAMVEGFAQYGAFDAKDITASGPHMETLERLRPTGVNLTTDNREAAKTADVVMLAVKPWLTEQVVKEIKDSMDYNRQTLVSVAAGVSSADLKGWLDKGDGKLPQLLIAMPNIAIAVGSSMTFIVPAGADEATVNMVEKIFTAAGSTLIVEERLLGQCISVSCSIAYAMRYVRASMEGCVELGFKAKDARKTVLQIVKGAVELLQHDGNHPEADIDNLLCHPGWSTVAPS